MRSYRQYCPVARAAEIVADRWTPLILRELLAGISHFNQLQRGLPALEQRAKKAFQRRHPQQMTDGGSLIARFATAAR